MGKRSGISRGDARRNARLLGLRGIVRRDRAVLAIDLADQTQVGHRATIVARPHRPCTQRR